MANKGHVQAHTSPTNAVVTGWQTFAPTVTLVGGAGNVTPVYTTNTGRYMQIGNLCFMQVSLTGDGGDEGAGTGQINIALPVTAGASWVAQTPGKGMYQNGGAPGDISFNIAAAATTVGLYKSGGQLTGADQNNVARNLGFSLWYECA